MLRATAPLRRTVTPADVVAVRDGRPVHRGDRLATEEPMEVRAGGPAQEAVPVAVTMRTPGHDFELAAGFLFTEGLIAADEVLGVSYCDLVPEEQHYNVVTVRLDRSFDAPAPRSFFATSSCGICGKASLQQVEVRCPAIPPGPVVAGSTLARLPEALRERQRVFEQTGGLHATGLFDAGGTLRTLREDVGRHNAVDKVVGAALLAGGLPLHDHVLQVSGRLSFEIVQKAAVAGVPIVSAVSAPSSLAVRAADRLGVTVVGFVRDGGFNVYTHPQRVEVGA
ncbi:MAG TPA: formate dehydrogenase accessory sulfurtransferase FdhD [Actinomycetota bacterium]|nr:formate dehydrogenase accessory sulfurtransferase FdhD [Actinomycetota bacterium]